MQPFMTKLKMLARQYRCSICIVTHPRKRSEKESRDMTPLTVHDVFGSVAQTRNVATVYAVDPGAVDFTSKRIRQQSVAMIHCVRHWNARPNEVQQIITSVEDEDKVKVTYKEPAKTNRDKVSTAKFIIMRMLSTLGITRRRDIIDNIIMASSDNPKERNIEKALADLVNTNQIRKVELSHKNVAYEIIQN